MLAAPFLLVFTAGLGVAVYSMLQGVTPSPKARLLSRASLRSAPSIAGFAVIFGAVGYLCTAHTALNPWLVLLIAAASGGLSVSITAPLLVMLSARMRAEANVPPSLEGQLARVSTPISTRTKGEIEFEHDGERLRFPALSAVGGPLEPGQEVVIERVTDGIAYVEDWNTVEQRL
jgi:membrane protein implicated in regulation of membrane protease activity